MITFDFETTKVGVPDVAELKDKPQSVEFAGVWVEDEWFKDSPRCEVVKTIKRVGELLEFLETDDPANTQQAIDDANQELENLQDRILVLSFLTKPKGKIPEDSIKIHGITDEHVEDEKPFPFYLGDLQDFFLGESTMVAHNLPYDRAVMRYELERIDKLFEFPWPPNHVCTVEISAILTGKKMNLQHLYQHLTGEEFDGWHRAISDTLALTIITKYLLDDEQFEL